MDYANITYWTEMVAFPLLSTLTIVPLVAMIIVLLTKSSVMALRIGFVGTILTVILSFYLLYVFDADRPGIQLYEQVYNIFVTYSVGVDGASILFIPLTAILAFLALVYTLTTRRSTDRIHIACLLGYEAILIGAFVAMNAMQFWFWCLLELVPVVLMTLRAGSGENRRWVVALLIQHWGSGLLMVLAGFLLLGFGIMDADNILTFDWLVLNQIEAELEYATLIFILLFYPVLSKQTIFLFLDSGFFSCPGDFC